MNSAQARVAAITATYRRPKELERLIDSLERSEMPLCGLVVVDNSGDEAVRELTQRSRIPHEYFRPGSNLGCGGGLAAGEQLALEKFGLTHLWILDDDAVIEPGTLGVLLEEMIAGHADAAHPLATDSAGRLGWFPGLLDAAKFREIRQPQTPEEFIARCGAEPVPFSWAQGIALLITRRALEELGFHRTDYWVRGEDLEFSLRITQRFTGLYVPRARVAHLPPEAVPGDASRESEFARHQAMLQNIAYTSLRLPHGRRIARTIPGNWLRFLKTWGWAPRALGAAIAAFWRGAVQGRPAGRKGLVGTAVPSRPARVDSRNGVERI